LLKLDSKVHSCFSEVHEWAIPPDLSRLPRPSLPF